MDALRVFSLPPGFGFHPTDVELISHYLKGKLLGRKIDLDIIPEIDIYKHEPWDLPARCQVPTRDSKWHFFASRDKKYPNGSRSNRATAAGYWKSTGKDRDIRHKNRTIGTKKTLVFHEGRPPCGKRTDWIMHEYYLNENECKANPELKDAFVLCRITKRDGWMQDDVNINEYVSPQSDNVNSEIIQSENASNCSNQPNEVASVEVEKPSSPSMSAEELEAWFSELLVPTEPQLNTFGDVKSETEVCYNLLSKS
ncbi:uncharacterized protein A4U43_C06F6390 [Asparagus officinalis]|uniref:NAC domain-containing protein n=1 Tax=Asparagus officinalis TaxID=4686 RepID=A0A5P1EK26_ASPOF|nr:NAC domain-containing protein 74-like [Asparagus officinalis]XP_020270298.1 NAC domain-containing protein 74-like [Asparagus officinalis]ONK66312.1 uncharacterized protein A4U43_C06F6390 [Asparagus officinalis]